MSESTTPLSTAIKRKLEEEDAESIEKEVDQTTDLVSAELKKKSKYQEEKESIQIEINENQTIVLDNKLKTNDEIDDQDQDQPDGKVALNNVYKSAKISANEQEDTATNEITSVTKTTETTDNAAAGTNVEREECKSTPMNGEAPTGTVIETTDDEPTQKVYDVLKERKDSKPLEDILQHDEAKKLTTQIKPTRILFPSSLSVTVKQYTDTDGIKKSVLPKRVIQPSITIVPIEKKTKDGKGNSEIDNGDEDCIDSISSGEANNACNLKIIPISSNATKSTMKVPKQSNSSIYPTGLITKRMVVKNISDGTLATTKKAIVSTLQCTPTTSRKIIAINRNKLMPINYKVQNSVFLPPPQSKTNKSAHDKPIITSIEYIPKDPFLSIGSTAEKSINLKSLNDEKANGNNINDCGMEDLIITGDSISTSSTHELPTAKPEKLQLCDSASIPTITPAYLKALSAYIEKAKNAHKAATVLKDSSVAESSISKDVSAETNPLVTKKSISKESSHLALENEISKDESTETNTYADEELDVEKICQAECTKSITNSAEQLDTGSVAVEKEANRDSLENDDVQCKKVEIEKRERSQALLTNHEEAKARNGKEAEKDKNDANHNESEQPEEKETLQINSLEGSESEKMEVEAAESETSHGAVEVGEVVEKRKLDFFDDDQPEDAEVENQIVNQNNSSTNKGELKLDCESVTAQSEANKECKVIEKKTNLFNYDEEPREGVDIEKQSLDQNKATECGINECAKTEVDENGDKQIEVDHYEDHTVVTDANGTGNNESIDPSENESTNDSCIGSSSKEKNINLDTNKGTKHAADETDKISIVQSSSTHEVYENEKKSSSESYANQREHENNKLDLNEGKNAENGRDDNDESVPSQHETDGIQTIPDIETALNKTFNNVFSTCVNSNKCNTLTQTNDSTIMLLKNISVMRRKVRRQAEEIVSLNAAMKLLDTASLLKTFDNY